MQIALELDVNKKPSKKSVHYMSESVEHYTPIHVLDLAVRVMRGIDIDPASPMAGPVTPAQRHFTKAENGLAHSWPGRVWMNPPYGNEIKFWVDKIIDEYERGSCAEAIILLPARPGSRWFRKLAPYTACYVAGRLKFRGNVGPSPFPSVAVYFGCREERFAAVFREIGDIHRCVCLMKP